MPIAGLARSTSPAQAERGQLVFEFRGIDFGWHFASSFCGIVDSSDSHGPGNDAYVIR